MAMKCTEQANPQKVAKCLPGAGGEGTFGVTGHPLPPTCLSTVKGFS